jgi:alpha-galactosidase
MLIGADMANIDQWTVDLLGNREVLAINQDPSGKAARRVWADNWTQVWSRQLSDGSVAVGLFNRAPVDMPVSVTFADVGITGPAPTVRFPWTHEDLTGRTGSGRDYTATVPRHGAVLMKIGKAQ